MMGAVAETTRRFSQASPLVKGLLTLLVIAAVVGGVLSLRPGQPDDDYGVAFSGLELKSAGEVVALLDEQRIPYRLDAEGSTILVPADRVYDVRLKAAAEGLPSNGTVGFELMDNLQLGATEFERRINYIRALQGELVRTITQLNQVAEARVHVALPETSLFVKDRQPATAAVFLRLVPGSELTGDEVRGIENLVSSAVEGLSPDDVTVVDTNGRILGSSADAREAGSGAPETNLDTQLAFQNQLEHSVQSLLEQVFGPGRVVVRVNADLNFDQKVIDRELFEPVADNEGLVASLKQLDETFEGNNAGDFVPAGSDANIPSYQSSAQTSDTSNYSRSEVTREYRLNQTHEQLVVAPGTVDRLTVAVMVNRELTPTEQNNIAEVVSAAIGADAQRSDQISVVGMAFDDSLANQIDDLLTEEPVPDPKTGTPTSPFSPALLNSAVFRYGLGAGAALLVAVALLLVLRRRSGKLRGPVAEQTASTAAPNATPRPGVDPRVVIDPSLTQAVANVRSEVEVKKLASQHPETVARVLRTWLDG